MSDGVKSTIANGGIVAESARMSAPDLRLKRFLELDSLIKEMTKELEEIKSGLKHQGSHSTYNFVVVVEERVRSNPPSLAALLAEYGEGVRRLCSESPYKIVKVSAKAGGES